MVGDEEMKLMGWVGRRLRDVYYFHSDVHITAFRDTVNSGKAAVLIVMRSDPWPYHITVDNADE